jgi:uncharacterized repeat protein (TIGR02543 family)
MLLVPAGTEARYRIADVWKDFPLIEGVEMCVVTFNSQGGSPVGSQSIANGSKAAQPAAPTREGYTFDGWYQEAACTNAWNFASDVVTANTTLYAKWTQGSTPTDPNNPGTAVASQGIAALQIYPNPVSDQITVTGDQWNAGDKVEIYNVNGTLVETRRAASLQTTINIAHLPAGVYIVKVGNKAAKIVKQ